MTTVLLSGIGELSTEDPELGVVHDAALVVEGGRVAWVGPARGAPAADTAYDVGGRAVVPGFVDSHTHLVFAGDRAEEFAARMTGTPYSAGGPPGGVAAGMAGPPVPRRRDPHHRRGDPRGRRRAAGREPGPPRRRG